MRRAFTFAVLMVAGLLAAPAIFAASAQKAPLSEATQACLECHREATPGIVANWQKGRMARRSVAQALKEPPAKRRVSAQKVPARLLKVAVGCAECHTMSPAKHQDNVGHDDYQIHPVVTPADCAACHPLEREQFSQNLMSHAHGNLMNNPLYRQLAGQVNSTYHFTGGKVKLQGPAPADMEASCLYCHGTKVEVTGLRTVESDLGDFKLPVLSGWPNHGVGRINPDGSKGSCGACHSRHTFAIAMARKPATCAECHKGPDVPAYKVYQVSKHGALFANLGGGWDYDAVPWAVGRDFGAPTCAGCHISHIVSPAGDNIASRTHRMNDRLGDRLLGLIYAHRHPKSPDTSLIKNADGQHLPTTFANKQAAGFLISARERKARRHKMQAICRACHASGWTQGQFARLDAVIGSSNQATLAATGIMQSIWAKKLADPANPFDELPEGRWTGQWLLWANNVRLAAAMMGADYGVFEDGRWRLTQNIRWLAHYLRRGKPK